jgi:ABC-2 type transport system permease protein
MNGEQLRALLWLRWRLTRNQWRRGGELNAVIMLVALVCGLLMALTGGVAGLAAGATAMAHASPRTAMFIWDGLAAAFLFFWLIGLVTELQRSEIIDLSRLLHLPISLRGVFLLNYLASHLSLSMAMALPAMLGLTIGLTWGRGPAMLMLLPLVFGFFFMITAWTYCLQGWLASLMMNKRRRRAIVIGITMVFVLLAQLPNLVVQFGARGFDDPPPKDPAKMDAWVARYKDRENQTVAWIETAHPCIPPLWLPHGARALMEDRAWPAAAGALGMTAIGAIGLAWAYRGALRFYRHGETKILRDKPSAPSVQPAFRADKKLFVERSLPGVPEEAAATALATFRSMSRAPEVKMALVMNFLILLILGGGILMRKHGAPSMPDVARPFMAGAAVLATFFGLVQVMFNHFGFDRGGFRAMVLAPIPRRFILLGKTLAMLPVAFVVFALYLAAIAALAHLGVVDVLAAVFEFVGAFFALGAAGSFTSILMPYRITPGSLKPTKTKAVTMLLLFALSLLFPVLMAPVFLPAGLGLLAQEFSRLPRAAVTLACAVASAVLSVLLYRWTLEPLGRLLQRREQRILQVVTQEVE